MSGKIIEVNELNIGDSISVFCSGALFGGTVTKITDKTIQLNNRRTLRKSKLCLIKKCN